MSPVLIFLPHSASGRIHAHARLHGELFMKRVGPTDVKIESAQPRQIDLSRWGMVETVPGDASVALPPGSIEMWATFPQPHLN